MAFILALDGRGFAELGSSGLKATDVVRATDRQEESLSEQMMLIRNTRKNLKSTRVDLRNVIDDMGRIKRRLQKLEKR